MGRLVTDWIDGRVTVFSIAFADRIVERCGIDKVGEDFGAWLLGLNDQLKRFSDD